MDKGAVRGRSRRRERRERRDRASWRERALAEVASLEYALERIRNRRFVASAKRIKLDGVERQLARAKEAAADRSTWKAAWYGSDVDATWANIHQVEVELLQVAPAAELMWWSADVLARVRQHLGAQDPRRRALEERLMSAGQKLLPEFRELAVRALKAANGAEESERARVRSFRNCLFGATMMMTCIAVAFAIWGAAQPNVFDLCFHDARQNEPACPTGGRLSSWDVLTVEAVGLATAALAGAASLRKIQGTTTPYMVPMSLMMLKLPAGAVASVIGLLLVRGSVVPGLSDLDTPGQILAWAAIFGAAQEAVTHQVDRRGQEVLEKVRGGGRSFHDTSSTAA
ncbi:hypothetical protein [Streptomyces sp. NBC_01803]|uniref:hypothetical protein n=1 Tax=Streptomyces sp. NBC_01803 TaxID=2975946 RepID=UPI002DDC5880|nr:hypothetical protein [Streptomyces sp. NBC_01803]WSA44727.1 hypothetical protein OIE51_11245 [Streptomyces sp. NBC_01803]